jgi:CheY-like chemotaxis protein
LSIVYGIVQRAGGYAWVYSEPGRGSTFKIYLPRVEHAEEPVTPPELTQYALGGVGTILLVEDELAIREVVHSYLTNLGYTVLPAADPAEALRVAKAYEREIHLLLTDVIMPGMTGYKLAAELDLPELKVLYMSGYSDRTISPADEPGQDVPFLQKPFALSTLARTIHDVLGTARAPSCNGVPVCEQA